MCRLIVENLIGKEFPTPQSSRKVSFSDKIKVIPWVWAVSAETSGSGLDNEPAVRPLICFENEEGDGRQPRMTMQAWIIRCGITHSGITYASWAVRSSSSKGQRLRW